MPHRCSTRWRATTSACTPWTGRTGPRTPSPSACGRSGGSACGSHSNPVASTWLGAAAHAAGSRRQAGRGSGTASGHDGPLSISAAEIMVTTTTLAAKAMPALLPLIAFRQIQLSLRRGNHASRLSATPSTARSCAASPGRSTWAIGSEILRTACSIGSNSGISRAAVRYIVNATIRHWRDHIYDTLQPVRDVANNGEIEYLGIAAGLYIYHSYFINHATIADTERSIFEASDLLRPSPGRLPTLPV